MTPSGIEVATFRLVAQCLNQLRICGGEREQYKYLSVRERFPLAGLTCVSWRCQRVAIAIHTAVSIELCSMSRYDSGFRSQR